MKKILIKSFFFYGIISLDHTYAVKRLCTVSETDNGLVLECSDVHKRFAAVFFKNGNFYIGQWNGQPQGYGIMHDLEKGRAECQQCREAVHGMFEKGNLIKEYASFGEYSGCFEDNCHTDIPIRHTMDYSCIGSYAPGQPRRDSLSGLAGCSERFDLIGEELGYRSRGSLNGEGIRVDYTKRSIIHGLFVKGKLTAIYEIKSVPKYYR